MDVTTMLNTGGHVIQNAMFVENYYVTTARGRYVLASAQAVLRLDIIQTICTILNVWVDDFAIFFFKLPARACCWVAVHVGYHSSYLVHRHSNIHYFKIE